MKGSRFILVRKAECSWGQHPSRAWDRRIAQRAAKVVVIGDGARSLYAQTRSLPSERLEVIRNWQDEQRFLDAHPRAQAAQHYAVDGAAFSFLYLGNIGPATDMELVIRAFAQASVANSQLLIVGDGSAKPACVALTRELGLKSARFLSCPSPSDVPALQSLADVCLLPLKKGVALNGVPSKLAAYLFSAKPVLATLDRRERHRAVHTGGPMRLGGRTGELELAGAQDGGDRRVAPRGLA